MSSPNVPLRRSALFWTRLGLALAVTGWIVTILLWQNNLGWNVQIAGSAGQWFGSIATAAVLSFTIWEVFSERRSRLDRESLQKIQERTAEASLFTVWPRRHKNQLGKPIGWEIAVRNNSRAPIFDWHIEVKARDHQGTRSQEFSASSDEDGAIPPSEGSATFYDFTDAGNEPGLTFEINVTWTDIQGQNWNSMNGLVAEVD
ncbi:hypothetical protein [Streptomyces sp. R35]|uniref:SMODS-associating 2TM beta-strand rich effector domain-containing protein n=1 Tax=Streptomyces sp. R35 TaxID=3238630 RepID=A0AB39SAJ6_9ACTN